jgi:hypothetical protein
MDPEFDTPLLDSATETKLKVWFTDKEVQTQTWKRTLQDPVPGAIDAQLKALGYAE